MDWRKERAEGRGEAVIKESGGSFQSKETIPDKAYEIDSTIITSPEEIDFV